MRGERRERGRRRERREKCSSEKVERLKQIEKSEWLREERRKGIELKERKGAIDERCW